MQKLLTFLLTIFLFTQTSSAQILDLTIGMSEETLLEHAINDVLGFNLTEQSTYIYKFQAALQSGSELEVIVELHEGFISAIFFSNSVPIGQSLEWDFFRHFKEANDRNPDMISSVRLNRYYESVFRSENCSVEAYENLKASVATIIYRYEEGDKFVQGRWIVKASRQ